MLQHSKNGHFQLYQQQFQVKIFEHLETGRQIFASMSTAKKAYNDSTLYPEIILFIKPNLDLLPTL